MPKVFVSTAINAPIERVWHVVRDFNGLPAWMPGMKTSSVEGGKDAATPGAIRRLALAGGDAVLRERLEALSDDDRRITYAVVEGPLPVRKVVTSMKLRPITDSYGTFGEWTSEFETEAGKEREGIEYMTRVFNAGWRALKRHLGV